MVPRIPFDVDKLRADIEAGRTHAAIAKEYGCSTRAVGDAARREGIIRPERHMQARRPELVDRAWLQREYVEKRRSLKDPPIRVRLLDDPRLPRPRRHTHTGTGHRFDATRTR